MPTTAFCYHCSAHHPLDAMRQIETKSGTRWRCIKSIAATKKSRAEREAFGRQMTASNKAEQQAKNARMNNSLGSRDK